MSSIRGTIRVRGAAVALWLDTNETSMLTSEESPSTSGERERGRGGQEE